MKLLLAVAAMVALATSSELEENSAVDSILAETMALAVTLENSRTFTKSASDFTLKFMTELSNANPRKSMVCSAFSVMPLVLELSLAAEGESHDQMQRVLGFRDDKFVRSVFPNALDKLTAIKGVTLNVGFANFIAQGYKVRKEFESLASKHFRSSLSSVDFSKPVDAANTINSWVENRTNHKIKDLVSPDSLDDLTRLVMCNAIYFKGEWATKFNKDRTRDRPFHKSSKESVSIPTMEITDNFKYGQSTKLNAKILELPYRGGEVSMFIILPDETEGLEDLIKKVHDEPNLLAEEINTNMYKDKVHVQIPKFKIESEIDLKELLMKLGIRNIFDEVNANLNKLIETDEKLYVSQAKQKATFEINEEGAEAAAANVFNVVAISAVIESEPEKFVADHPFIFYLKTTNLDLFIGTFAN